STDPDLWRWSVLFLRQCTEARARANTLRKHRLAVYSQSVLHEVLAAERIEYDRNARGILCFHPTQQPLDLAPSPLHLLRDPGHPLCLPDRARVAPLDPSLAPLSGEIAGGIYCLTDETGDSNKFTRALADLCRSRGAEIATGVTIEAIETAGDEVRSVKTNR